MASSSTSRFDRGTVGIVLLVAFLALTGCTSTPPSSGGPGEVGTIEERLRAHLDLAQGYLDTGDTNRARRPLERAEELVPRSWEVQSLRARIFAREGDFELAERHFRQAIRYAGSEARLHNDFGVFLYERGRYEEAVEQLSRAVADPANPQRAIAYENLGLAQLEVGARTEARNAFNRAIMLRERMPVSLLELAELAFEDSDYAQATTYFDRFRGMSRPTPRSLWLGIRLARVFGNADAEASYALQLRNLYRDSEEFLRYQESLSDG